MCFKNLTLNSCTRFLIQNTRKKKYLKNINAQLELFLHINTHKQTYMYEYIHIIYVYIYIYVVIIRNGIILSCVDADLNGYR